MPCRRYRCAVERASSASCNWPQTRREFPRCPHALDLEIREPLRAARGRRRRRLGGQARQVRQMEHGLRVFVAHGVTAIDQKSDDLGMPEA